MLSDVFYWVLNMSILLSVVGIVLYLLAKVQRIPRSVICLLWAIPFLRGWIPFGINSRYSLMSLISKFTSNPVAVYDGTVDVSSVNFIMGAESYFPITYKTELLANVFAVAAVIWLVTAVVLLMLIVVSYITTKAALKGARHLYDNVYLSDKTLSPAVYGIFRGKIILSNAYEKKNLPFVFLHENAHIKRKDNLWRVLALITACVHWFNPLVWLFLKAFFESIELACDEAVLKTCSREEKKTYAATLLRCAESKSLFASAFGGAKIKTRIERIITYKKLSAFSAVCFLILAGAIGYVLLTNAK